MNQRYIVPLNLSKLGFRYFRVVFESKQFSNKFINYVVSHPNTGYVFEGSGWSGKKRLLGIGIWATSNSEIADISTNIRSIIPSSYKVVYQSELTRLEYFAEIDGSRKTMSLIDELEQKISLSPLELDYLKLLSVDGALSIKERAAILNLSVQNTEDIDDKLRKERVFYGVFPNGPLPVGYTKYFVDTTALKHEMVEEFFALLKQDRDCIYLARGNGIYNVEFEYVVKDSEVFKIRYGKFLMHSKAIVFDKNIYTNLFPQSKSLNTKIVQEKFIELAKVSDKHFDFSDSELWYVNHEGTQSYLDIYDNAAYRQSMKSGEVELFSKAVASFKDLNNQYNLIDLGSGDGKKGKELISVIGDAEVRSYFPVDVQELELSQAVREHTDAAYLVQPTILDFSKLAARFPVTTRDNETNVYAFLGGTYGNFDSRKINQYLKPLLKTKKDVLLIGIAIRDFTSRSAIVKEYMNEKVQGVAFGVLKQIGFDKDDLESNSEKPELKLQMRWEGSRLRSGFTLRRNKLLHGLHIEAGATFNLTSSWKPTLAEFKEAVSRDFEIIDTPSNRSFAIAVCRKKEV